jgi:hypothetical protein
MEEMQIDDRPRKRYFRSRAHCNPLSYNDSFNYPVGPTDVDWEALYPSIPPEQRSVSIVDLGMGFGGLTIALAKHFQEDCILGIEIRAKVTLTEKITSFKIIVFVFFRYVNMFDYELKIYDEKIQNGIIRMQLVFGKFITN